MLDWMEMSDGSFTDMAWTAFVSLQPIVLGESDRDLIVDPKVMHQLVE